MEYRDIKIDEKSTSTLNRETLMKARFNLDKVFVYREPEAKTWQKNVFHFCIFSKDGNKAKFLHNMKEYNVEDLQQLAKNETISCLFRLDETVKKAFNVNITYKKKDSRKLSDISNCEIVDAPFSQETKNMLNGLKNKEAVSFSTLINTEKKFVEKQNQIIQAKNGQSQLLAFN